MRKIVFTIILILICPLASGDNRFLQYPTTNGFAGSSMEFSVDITKIALGPEIRSDDENVYPISNWGTIDIVTSKSFSTFSVALNISGYLHRDFGNVTYEVPIVVDGVTTYNQTTVDLGMENLVIGSMYAILDDQINVITAVQLEEGGLPVVMPYGDHTLTILTIAIDGQGEYHYASESMVFRISNETITEAYEPWEVATIFNVDDQYVDKQISANAIDFKSNLDTAPLGVYDRNVAFAPELSTTLTFEDAINRTENVVTYDSGLSFTNDTLEKMQLDVITNSTGFNDLQIYESWNSTKGISFLLDAEGLHPLADGQTNGVIKIRKGNNYVGVLTLAPYGLWHSGIPHPITDVANNIVDWDTGINSFVNPSGSVTNFNASMDFVHTISGVHFRASKGVLGLTTTTIENTIEQYWELMVLPAIAIVTGIALVIRRRTRQ